MAKSIEGQPKSVQENPLLADAWLNGFGSNLFAAAGQAYGKACSRWLQECARFAEERLQKAHEAGARLVSCENTYDLSRVQQEYLHEVFSAYVAESNRVVELAVDIGKDAFRQNGAKQGKSVG